VQGKAIASWNGITKSELDQLSLPLLILCAKNDLVVPMDAISYLFEHSNHSKLITYSQGGHFLIHKYPRQIARDIINFYGN
jgi:esterase/lipase